MISLLAVQEKSTAKRQSSQSLNIKWASTLQPKLHRKAVNLHSLLWTPGMKKRKQQKPSPNWWLWVGRRSGAVTRASLALRSVIGKYMNRRRLYVLYALPMPFLILNHLKGAWPLDGKENAPLSDAWKPGSHANLVTAQQRMFATTFLSPEMDLRSGTEWVKIIPFQLSHIGHCSILLKLITEV